MAFTSPYNYREEYDGRAQTFNKLLDVIQVSRMSDFLEYSRDRDSVRQMLQNIYTYSSQLIAEEVYCRRAGRRTKRFSEILYNFEETISEYDSHITMFALLHC